MDKALEAAARALIEDQIRRNRKWDTPADELERRLPAGIAFGWRERVPDAEIAITAYLAQREADGPTEAEIKAIMPHTGFAGDAMARQAANDIFRAMIAARPKDGE